MATITDVTRELQFEDSDLPWIGVNVVTDTSIVQVAIDNHRSCCEEYGVFAFLPDDTHLDLCARADVERLRAWLVGALLHTVAWDDRFPLPEGYEMHKAPVRLTTDRGVLHLVPWCEHNGYYPHYVRVAWPGYTDTQEL
jgi:hypothetical protein